MTTDKQIIANRLNGLKGGVKTDAGKAAVRLIAVSHGIFCHDAQSDSASDSELDVPGL